MADAGIYNALMAPRKSAFDYAREFEQDAFNREQMGMQRQQNALQLRMAQRAEDDDNALRNFMSSSPNLDTAEGQAGLYKANPKAAPGILKNRAEVTQSNSVAAASQANAKKTSFELRRAKAVEAVTDIANLRGPQEAEASITRHLQAGDIDMPKATMLLNSLRGHPGGFEGWRLDMLKGVMSVRDRLDYDMKANNELIGPDGKVNQSLLDAKRSVAAAGASRNTVSVNNGQKGLDNEFKLRGEFKQEPVYKAHQEMQAAHSQIRQAIAQGTPIGDMAAATKIMKLLDPNSVVRESELGLAMASTGLLDRATNYAQNIISGNKLTPKQRQEFNALADQLLGESTSQYNAKRSEYQRLGGEYGLNADRALGPDVRNAPGAPGTGNAPSGVVRRFNPATGKIE